MQSHIRTGHGWNSDGCRRGVTLVDRGGSRETSTPVREGKARADGGVLGRSCTKEWGKQKRAIIPSWQTFGKVMTKPRSATRAILMNIEECHYSQL